MAPLVELDEAPIYLCAAALLLHLMRGKPLLHTSLRVVPTQPIPTAVVLLFLQVELEKRFDDDIFPGPLSSPAKS